MVVGVVASDKGKVNAALDSTVQDGAFTKGAFAGLNVIVQPVAVAPG